MTPLRALLAHPSGRIGGGITALLLLAAGAATLGLTPHDPLAQHALDRLRPPGGTYWFGTDLFGRDIASRLMSALGVSFTVAFSAVGAAALAGTLIGLVAAWWGGLADGVLMRAMDILLAFPAILLALLIVAVAGAGAATSVVAIGVVYTPIFARVVRGAALSLVRREFVDAARSFGSAPAFILSRHILQNLAGPLGVQVTLSLAWALLTESGLSFLGLGTQPPTPSLGLMLSDSRTLMESAPWLMIGPALCVVASILGFNLLGDALRDVLDPKRATRQ